MRFRQLAFGMLATVALLGASERSAFADFCIRADNGVGYQLQIGTANPSAGTPFVIGGTRVISTIRTPVSGSLIVTGGNVVIGLYEPFNFGSGLFTHPMGTTIITIPSTGTGFWTYDTTFHGNGAPHNVMGFVSAATCPLSVEGTAQKDPNGK